MISACVSVSGSFSSCQCVRDFS
uniref:Uncharacterized protein n=1 Tax=Anguilla anguilla TaxID=7936 RepID=A0A0E9PR79_ANGAN